MGGGRREIDGWGADKRRKRVGGWRELESGGIEINIVCHNFRNLAWTSLRDRYTRLVVAPPVREGRTRHDDVTVSELKIVVGGWGRGGEFGESFGDRFVYSAYTPESFIVSGARD